MPDKPWVVECYAHSPMVQKLFKYQRDASREWVDHNRIFHKGELTAIIFDMRNR